MKKNQCFLEMPANMACNFKFSRYNIYLDDKLVYNTYSQVVSEFNEYLINENEIPQLLEGGVIVPVDKDELSEIEDEYKERHNLCSDLQLTIATTLDCQFRCMYCYESHPKAYMSVEVKRAIVDMVKANAMSGKNIRVVWYGGEPLLDFESVCTLTREFKDICHTYGVSYHASMISNGYLFSAESIALLDELRIHSIQITLDGMKETHDKRRPLINGNASSFERIIQNMKEIKKRTSAEVRLRINVDKSNIKSAYELVRYCSSVGLDDIDLTLGMIKVFGCDHVYSAENMNLFSTKEFSAEFLQFRDYIFKMGFKKAARKMVPEYKVNSCTLDAPNAYVIDPYGWVYKCMSQVGKQECSIGNVTMGFNENAHNLYTAFQKQCSACRYFPICKGGCLLNNSGGKARECNVWRYITEDILRRELVAEIT